MFIDKMSASFDEKTVTGDELGDSIDLGASSYLGGGDQPAYLCAHLSGVDKGNGNETYVVKWQTDDNVDGSGNLAAAADIPGMSMTFSRNNATDFKWVTLGGQSKVERYIAAACNFGGTSPSAKVTAWVTFIKPEKYVAYADAVDWS